ncbi:LysE family translocator [Ferrovibrio xuzhouensis]|uniref:LysE family translocator n=1 Tax=Ferrovibrio xuzhouensis TaxID=1576914 RepID=A0ABV7VD43_9PROT
MSPEFLIIALVVVIAPGTGVLYTLSAALGRGARASVIAALGCMLGIVPHMLAAITGLAALLQASGMAFAIFKYAGVAYLLWMAWQSWRATGTLTVSVLAGGSRPALRIAGQGILVNLLNPKLSVFFLAFLPQFVPAGAPDALGRMLELSAVFMAMTFVVFVLYGLCAASVRDRVIGSPTVMTWLRRSFAAAFVALGAKLALAER